MERLAKNGRARRDLDVPVWWWSTAELSETLKHTASI
jgi:hypothetical protein